MKMCLFLFFILSAVTFAHDTKTLKNQEEIFVFYHHNGFWITENCLKEGCDALRTPLPRKTSRSVSSWDDHPAESFCRDQDGKYIVGSYPDQNQDGICQFKDKSAALAWNFFLNHNKTND